jgi:rhamnosyl/mannosyltransferase
MKILELGKFYPPVRGGIETLLKSLCEGFVRKGAEVECVVANNRAATLRENINGVNVQRLRSFGTLFSTSLCPGYIAAAKKSNANIWHTHFPNPNADRAILAAPDRARIVITYHSEIVRQAWMMKLYGPIVERTLRRADRIVVASPKHLEHCRFLQPHLKKCVVIPFGIDAAKLTAPIPISLHMPTGPRPILLTVGRLVGYKGHRYLIEAMRNIQATLWIVGSGPLENELRQQAAQSGLSERVHFLGNVADDQLPALYQACDIFVLPSITPNEAFGVVQLEAMACGKPVVSCDLASGVPWVNQHEATGLIVPPRDANALGNAIQKIANDSALANRLGEAGRARVANEFTEQRMIDSYHNLFTQLAA